VRRRFLTWRLAFWVLQSGLALTPLLFHAMIPGGPGLKEEVRSGNIFVTAVVICAASIVVVLDSFLRHNNEALKRAVVASAALLVLAASAAWYQHVTDRYRPVDSATVSLSTNSPRDASSQSMTSSSTTLVAVSPSRVSPPDRRSPRTAGTASEARDQQDSKATRWALGLLLCSLLVSCGAYYLAST
jgi:hypothetical protein